MNMRPMKDAPSAAQPNPADPWSHPTDDMTISNLAAAGEYVMAAIRTRTYRPANDAEYREYVDLALRLLATAAEPAPQALG